MFGRKKKPKHEYPDDVTQMVERLAEQQARKVVRAMLHLGCPTIVVTGSDGITPAWQDRQSGGFGHNTYQETEFVERGRWWARVGEHRVLGELGRHDNTQWTATRFYKGYATPDAAQKAAEKWYENRPSVKVK